MSNDQPVSGTLRKVCLALLILAAVLFALLGILSSRTADYPLQIGEVMARNSSLSNPDGLCCDWVEVTNVSSSRVNLSGYHLTDDPDVAKFTFPAGTRLDAGGSIVVYCLSGASGTCLYAPFSVSGNGETLYLLTPGGALADEAVLPASSKDTSLIRSDAGFIPCDGPTPGYPNTPEGRNAWLDYAAGSDSSGIVISEIISANRSFPAPGGGLYDIIELTNTGTVSADLGGMGLSDRQDQILFIFPKNTELAPGQCLVVYCDSSAEASSGIGADILLAPFGLGRNGGETVSLYSALGAEIDSVQIPAMDKDCSYTRTAAGWRVSASPTPGTPDLP